MIQKLGEICDFHSGNAWKASKFKEEGIPIIRINNMKPNATDFKYWDWEEDYDPKYFVNEGDILVSLSGTIKTYKWVGEKALLNQRIVRVTPKEDVNIDWVYYQISNVIERISDKGKDAVIKNVSVNDLKKYEVEVPDLPTQNKIVTLLDKASALVQEREKSIALLDVLLRAQFLDMFGDPVLNPKGWEINKFIDLCTKITDGTHKTPKYLNEGIPFISAKNLKGNKIYWDDIKYVSEEESTFINKRCNVEKGDILLTKSGSLGQPAIIDVDFKFSVFESLALIKYKRDRLNNSFLLAFLESEAVLFLYKRRTKGVAVKHLHLIDIKSIPIITPPISLQNQFETIYLNIQVQKETLTQSKNDLENLYDSLLQRAFNGQLNFNVDAELDVLLAAIDIDKENNDIRDIATVYASRLLERLDSQDFETQAQYQQAKQVAFQMLKEGAIEQEYDTKNSAVKMKLA
ncbi:restriction endonuclease subunit S [Mariniflexile ostreae]|uniref:Restriction endonuclease subunit S n=1 Tax=Mariniflexile ostreae TaxID=1520892 RepID=A0ABV5FB95_9FLAO